MFRNKTAHSLKLHGVRGRGENDHMDVGSMGQSESKTLVKLSRQRVLANSLYCSCNFSMHLKLKVHQNKKLQKQMSALDSQQCKNLPLIKAYTISSFLRCIFFIFSFGLNFFFLIVVVVLGLRCCTPAFSSWGAWGLVFIVVHRRLTAVAAPVVEHRLYAHRLQWLQHLGSVVVAQGLSCSVACHIFPAQGLNMCPLHWQILTHWTTREVLAGASYDQRCLRIHRVKFWQSFPFFVLCLSIRGTLGLMKCGILSGLPWRLRQ